MGWSCLWNRNRLPGLSLNPTQLQTLRCGPLGGPKIESWRAGVRRFLCSRWNREHIGERWAGGSLKKASNPPFRLAFTLVLLFCSGVLFFFFSVLQFSSFSPFPLNVFPLPVPPATFPATITSSKLTPSLHTKMDRTSKLLFLAASAIVVWVNLVLTMSGVGGVVMIKAGVINAAPTSGTPNLPLLDDLIKCPFQATGNLLGAQFHVVMVDCSDNFEVLLNLTDCKCGSCQGSHRYNWDGPTYPCTGHGLGTLFSGSVQPLHQRVLCHLYQWN